MNNNNSNNNTSSQVGKATLGSTMAEISAKALVKRGPIDTSGWIDQLSKAWEKTLEKVPAASAYIFIMNLKVFALSDTYAVLNTGLGKGGANALNSRPTQRKKNDVEAFILVSKTLNAMMVSAGCDMRAYAAGTILRIPSITTMLSKVYEAQRARVVPSVDTPVLYTSAIANCLTLAQFTEMFSYRSLLQRLFFTCMGAESFVKRAAGSHRDGYYQEDHYTLSATGLVIFKGSSEEWDGELPVESAKALMANAAGTSKDSLRQKAKALIIGGLMINPKKMLETSDFKQNKTDTASLEFIGDAMAGVCHMAKVPIPAAGFEIGNKESESMKAFWKAFTVLKDTRRAILSVITKKGGANTRAEVVVKPKTVQTGFQLF